MKIIFKQTLLQRILAAISEARKFDEEIDYIELTKVEYARVCKQIGIPIPWRSLRLADVEVRIKG